MLQQKWVVMAGDSITRFMFAALLRLLAEDGMLLTLWTACAIPKPQACRLHQLWALMCT